jgi:hypothetical protein
MPVHEKGKDVLLDALNSPIQARNANVSRLPINQPDYEFEPQYKVLPDLALPKTQWTIPRWPTPKR